MVFTKQQKKALARIFRDEKPAPEWVSLQDEPRRYYHENGNVTEYGFLYSDEPTTLEEANKWFRENCIVFTDYPFDCSGRLFTGTWSIRQQSDVVFTYVHQLWLDI